MTQISQLSMQLQGFESIFNEYTDTVDLYSIVLDAQDASNKCDSGNKHVDYYLENIQHAF